MLKKLKKEVNVVISIIIPVYNGEGYLQKCIESIQKQTYSDIEIILINDGSTDNSGRICDEFTGKDKRIKVIHKKNEGVSIARNIGIQEAKGEYIGFVDCDDYLESAMYEKLLKSIVRNKADMAICNYSNNEYFNLEKETLNQNELFDLILDKDKFRGYPWNKLYKSELLKNLNFNKSISLCEDLLFNCEYVTRCKKISIIDEKLYNYIKREGSAINTFREKHFSVIKAYQEMERIYIKYSRNNLIKLQSAYLKQCTFLKYYNFIGNYDKKYKTIIAEESKRLIKEINGNKIPKKEKIILDIYYYLPLLVGFVRELKYRRIK